MKTWWAPWFWIVCEVSVWVCIASTVTMAPRSRRPETVLHGRALATLGTHTYLSHLGNRRSYPNQTNQATGLLSEEPFNSQAIRV